MVYSNGPGVISLFEQPLKAREQLDRKDLREYILRLVGDKERMAILGWVTERLSFNLIGEMTLSDLMKIAEEIQERCLTDKAKQYYRRLYEGKQDDQLQKDTRDTERPHRKRDRSSG